MERQHELSLLRKAWRLYKDGLRRDAIRLIQDVLRSNPNSEDGWWVLSWAVEDKEKKVYCLRRVLSINPANQRARDRLALLEENQRKISSGNSPLLLGQSKKQNLDHNRSKRGKKKRRGFHPKFLTILGGIFALMGTVFGWLKQVYYPLDISQPPLYLGHPETVSVQSGLSTAAGLVVAVVGVLVIVLTVFRESEPGKPNALPASLLSLAAFLMSCGWWGATTRGCIRGDCYAVYVEGGGYNLSMLALFLTFFFGLIPSPSKEKHN